MLLQLGIRARDRLQLAVTRVDRVAAQRHSAPVVAVTGAVSAAPSATSGGHSIFARPPDSGIDACIAQPTSSASRVVNRLSGSFSVAVTVKESTTTCVAGLVLPHAVTGQAALTASPAAFSSQSTGTNSMSAVQAWLNTGPSSGSASAATRRSTSPVSVSTVTADQRPSSFSTVSMKVHRYRVTGSKSAGTSPAAGASGCTGTSVGCVGAVGWTRMP